MPESSGIVGFSKKIVSPLRGLSALKTLGKTYAIGLIADQGSKVIINAILPEHPNIKASLGISPQDLQTIINFHHYTQYSAHQFLELLGSAVLPVLMIYAAAKKMNLKNDRIYQFGLGLLGAGTMGNLINQLIFNYTTDFLHVPFTLYYTNLADMMTFVGLPIFLWRTIANRGKA